MSTRLAALALARTLGGAAALVALAVGWLALQSGADLPGARPTRAAALEAVWVAFLVLAAPLVAARAAALRRPALVRALAAARSAPAASALSLVSGVAAGALLVALAWTLLASFAPGEHAGSEPALACAAPGPGRALLASGAGLRWSALAPDEPGLTARVELSLALAPGGGGPARFAARRGGAESQVRAFLQPAGALELELPRGAGQVEFELALEEAGARAFLTAPDVTLWRQAPAGTAAARLCERAACALVAWSALAFGLAAWVRPATAVLLLAACWIAAWSSGLGAAWLPGGDWIEALGLAARGRAPAPAGFAAWLGAAAACALGAALGRARPGERT